jgi:hypothetical protein
LGPDSLTSIPRSASTSGFRERVGAEIRAEAFNVLNVHNYNQIARIINAPGFGSVQSELPMRELQFGAKITF